MLVHKNISLKKYNTFGIDVPAHALVEFYTDDSIALWLAEQQPDPESVLVLGQGSNFLFTGPIKQTVLKLQLDRIEVLRQTDTEVWVRAGGGTDWDSLVEYCVQRGWSGIENLSYIPGTAGAAPVQNIGAYGTELKDVFDSCEAYELRTGQKRVFHVSDCAFGYRQSFFKAEGRGQYLISSITLRLAKDGRPTLRYQALSDWMAGQPNPSLAAIRQAVIEIRQSKLPEPSALGSAGSFFKNPVVSRTKAEALRVAYPNMPLFPGNEGMVKLSAGWLIEHLGLKGYRQGDAGVYAKQALVLVNHGNATGQDLLGLAQWIQQRVAEHFGVQLEPEVWIV